MTIIKHLVTLCLHCGLVGVSDCSGMTLSAHWQMESQTKVTEIHTLQLHLSLTPGLKLLKCILGHSRGLGRGCDGRTPVSQKSFSPQNEAQLMVLIGTGLNAVCSLDNSMYSLWTLLKSHSLTSAHITD